MEILQLLSSRRYCLANIQQLNYSAIFSQPPLQNSTHSESESESELLYDWPFTTNQFIVASSPLRLTISNFFQLNPDSYSPYVTSSLTKGWVCRLQFLLALASAVTLGSESRGNHDHILQSQFRDSPNLEGQVPVFIFPRNRVARLYPQALDSLFVASYDSQGYGGGIRARLHTGSNWLQSQSQNYFTTGGLSQISSSWRQAP
jgi:hypothetical protein